MREIVPGNRNDKVAELMNAKFNTDFTKKQMQTLKSRLKLKSGLPTNVKGMQKKLTTPEQDEFIHENYKGLYNKELADLVNERFKTNLTTKQIKAYKARNKLDSGIGGHFKEGAPAWNKGLQQKDYMSKEAIARTKRTRFKKGQIPPNRVPIGTERISKDGYIEVKIQDGQTNDNYEFKHRVLWMAHHGEIPDEHIVIFKNGDKEDIRIENLMMVHRGISLHLNKQGLHSEHPELTEAGVNLVKLQFKTNEMRRKK